MVDIYNKRSNEVITDEWATIHVAPYIGEIPIVGTLEDLLSDFAQFYLSWAKRGDVDFLWYGGHVVEAYLFRLLRDRGLIGDFDAPYTPIELTAYLMMIGADPSSVEEYLISQGIELPEGVVDTPIYDCKISYICYRHILRNYSLAPVATQGE